MIDEKRSPWIPVLGVIFLLLLGIIGYQFFVRQNPVAVAIEVTPTPRPSRTPIPALPTLTPLPTFTPVPTSTPIPNAVNDNDYAITYNNWIGVSDAAASGGGYRKSIGASQAIVYQTAISTTAISLITYRGPDQGMADVIIDGQRQERLDLYSATPEYQVVQEYSGLPNTAHTISVRGRNNKNAASTGNEIRVDGYRVGDETIEDNRLEVRYRSWEGTSDDNAYGGSYRSTEEKDAVVSFTFSGTRLDWVTMRCPRCGKAEVSVDGTSVRTVDLYSDVTEWRHIESFENLSAGEHQVTIRVLGEHNPESNRSFVAFDAYGVP